MSATIRHRSARQTISHLRQIVGAEAEKGGMLRNVVGAKSRARRFNHHAQPVIEITPGLTSGFAGRHPLGPMSDGVGNTLFGGLKVLETIRRQQSALTVVGGCLIDHHLDQRFLFDTIPESQGGEIDVASHSWFREGARNV